MSCGAGQDEKSGERNGQDYVASLLHDFLLEVKCYFRPEPGSRDIP
jgi:hypothetical protein